MNATMNGRARKTLADQIDRLDTLLDGLAEGLNEAVAPAVTKAVRTVLTEVLSHPEVVARAHPAQPSAEPKPVPGAALAAAARRVGAWVREKCGIARQAIVICFRPLIERGHGVRRRTAQLTATIRAQLLGPVLWGISGLGRVPGLLRSRIVWFGLGLGLGAGAGWIAPVWCPLIVSAALGAWSAGRSFLGHPS